MPIEWRHDGAVGVGIIDRPERRNALSAELCEQLTDALTSEPDLGAVVLTGAGDRAFCAGADLGRRADDTQRAALEHGGGDAFRPAFEALIESIVSYPAPVIAAVNGAALGAGMQLAVACDLRVAAPNATFGIPAARLGVLLSAGNIRRLALVVGQAAARDILLSARVLDRDEAEAVGLVQRRADDAFAAACALADEIAGLAPLSVRGHKHALNLFATSPPIDPAMRDELARREAEAFASDDLQEGLTAFGEKRAPDFRGR
jgi:enoyl-CoA hydratase/carnithine racemase